LHPRSNRNVKNITSMQYISQAFKIASLYFTQNLMRFTYSLKTMFIPLNYLCSNNMSIIMCYFVEYFRFLLCYSANLTTGNHDVTHSSDQIIAGNPPSPGSSIIWFRISTSPKPLYHVFNAYYWLKTCFLLLLIY
jgi:hypothetical protein